jgi:murein DD-endopeptidase MepM/ murein hydrolase activator NlpD
MAKVGYASALGGIAKDAISGAGKGFVGGLKGAMMSEAPGLTGAYAFGKELKNRANAPKTTSSGPLSSGGSSNQSSNSSSSSAMGGGLTAGIFTVAGQQKQSNVINLEQVRQLRQLNNNVINQSKLIAFQVNEAKRKELFAEELANEQALRDDKLLNAIQNIGGNGKGGRGGAGGETEGDSGGTLAFVSGLVFKRILTTVITAVVRHPYVAGGLALGAGVAAAAAAARNRPAPPASTVTGRDAQNDPANAARRAKDMQATGRTIPRPADYVPGRNENRGYSQNQSRARLAEQQKWDALNKGTHDPVTGMPKNSIIMKPPATGVVSSKFGVRKDPKTGKDTQHNGVDIAMPMGTSVTPVAPGKVVAVTTSKDAGTYVSVQHADGKISEYMHLQRTSVKIGDAVDGSTEIGKSGGAVGDPGAGKSTGPHLHLQIRDSATNKFIDPVSLPGLTHLVAGASVKGTDSTPVLKGPVSQDAQRKRRNDAYRAVGTDFNVITNYDGMPNVLKDKGLSKKSTSAYDQILAAFSAPFDKNKYGPGIKLAAGAGFKLDGGGGGGTTIKDDAPVSVHDKKAFEQDAKIAKLQGLDVGNGSVNKSVAGSYGKALNTQSFKPLFRSNSDIIAQVNKTFLQQFRSTATAAFTQAITKGLFPKGVGVSFSQASQDDMYRGQQLQKIFGTSDKISSATTKLLGKQYGPMFAPLFDNLAQGYLEVGSRMAGKAIFQGIGGLDAKETQGIMGQVLGNYAAGNKKLAFEQLLFGASGGAKSGIALGPETLFAKYGFANPMEGISYFASALGERATQPFAKLMGADDRNKSVIFDPRTKQYVYADSGAPASQADIRAAGADYGGRVSQTPMFGPGMNNYGMPGAPYQTTAGVRGTYQINNSGAYSQILNARPGQEISRAQAFGLTDQQQAAGGARLIAEQNTMLRAQGEVQNKQLEQQAKLAEEAAKREFDIASKQASSEAEMASAQAAYDKALNEAKTSTDRVDTDRVIAKLDQVGGKPSGGGTEFKTGPGSGRRTGQLFDANTYDENGVRIGTDSMKEIGNFAFDMGKNMLGQQLTKDIKNPYAQMVANFAIQKGLNYGVEAIMKSDFVSNIFSTGAEQLAGPASSSFIDTAIDWVVGLFADGGRVTGPGTGRSDSIPAMLSNGEFVVNSAATKTYGPLLDSINAKKYADGTASTPGSANALSKALGTDKQLNALGSQTDLLTSIDGSLRMISGQGTSSGTGLSFDSGLGGLYGGSGGGSISSGNAGVMNGVARSRATQQKPSTMDYVTAIGTSVLKSMAISKGIGMASTALFGATPMALASNFYGGAQLAAAGFTPATFVGPLAPGALTGMEVGGTLFGTSAAVGQSAAVTEAVLVADSLGGAAAAGAGSGIGASLAAAAPYVLAAVAVYMIVDSVYGGGGGSAPPPKEPKYHAGIYVAGNNNINAIAPILETVDYHAPPDVYKTIAYGLLRVAFNATKSSEAVTNMTASYDFIYLKVQFDKISMIVGKGAPNSSYTQDGATDTLSWPAPSEGTNLNAIAKDIITWVRDDFKKLAKAENLSKLDTAAEGLGTYTLDELSKGLIPDLQRGKYKLDQSKEKGIYANNVAESNRIAELISTAATKAAYISSATAAEYDSDGNITKEATPGGENMVYSMKQGKFVKNPFGPDAILLDQGDRPVYNLEGTSAGLTVDDFASASVVGSNRPANILADTPASGGSTSNIVVGPTSTKVDNSAITNYYTPTNGIIDVVRGATPQVG